MICNYCKGNLKLTLTPHHIHYGRLDCINCGKFSGWARNPESPRIDSKRIGNHADKKKILDYHKMKNEICFFCLRNKEQLGLCETMTIDHIIELDKGGDDEFYNMQIFCSACHKLKNWARLYMNWHFNKEGENDTTKTTD